jgi:hypothetical protein
VPRQPVRMWVMSCSCGVRRLPGLGCVILSAEPFGGEDSSADVCNLLL